MKQQYLPDKIKDKIFYEPSGNGYEAKIKPWLDEIRKQSDGDADNAEKM